MVWSSTSVVSTVLSGFQPIGSNANQLNTNTYAPPDPADEIPQQAIPVSINLWCYEAVPSSGNDVEVVLQDFQFIPEGEEIPDAGAPSTSADAAPEAGEPEAGGADGAADATVPGAVEGGLGGDAGGPASNEPEGPADAGGPAEDSSSSSGGTGCSVRTEGQPVGRMGLGGVAMTLYALAVFAARRRRTIGSRPTPGRASASRKGAPKRRPLAPRK